MSAGSPRLFVISGPSGAGKGTLIRGVLERQPDLPPWPCRPPRAAQRAGEVDGREYYFLSDDEFQRRVDNGEFEEHVSFAGGRYGTLKAEVDRLLAEGCTSCSSSRWRARSRSAAAGPTRVLIFIDAPLDELERRLRAPRDGVAPATSRCGSRSPASSSRRATSSTT